MDLSVLIKSHIPHFMGIREELHKNAELAHQEFKTQKIVERVLWELGLQTKTSAGTGVTAALNQGSECIAVRADMDALPVNGVFHACGHDYHMAIALGTAFILKELGFDKCIKFIFQPAEEAEGGALPMIEDGVLENPNVKYMIGFHVWPNLPVGQIEVGKGASMASVDDFKVLFKGRGGHAAMPHLCKNPILPAVNFTNSLIVKSKVEVDPLNPFVLTVSSIQGGSANNVIPEDVKVLGTVRTFDNDLRNKLYEEIRRNAQLSAEQFGCDVDVSYSFQYPPVINDVTLTELFIQNTQTLLGANKVIPLVKTFAAEDFAFFAEKVPSVHFRIGISDEVQGKQPLHSPDFTASEETLFYGIYTTTNFILNLGRNL